MDTGVVSLPPSHRLLINGSYGEHARPVQPAPI
jgi:TctA family transporter